MRNKRQYNFIVSRLEKKGEISRNECLKNYISRLGAYIHKLKREGYRFDTFKRSIKTVYGRGYDYVYKIK